MNFLRALCLMVVAGLLACAPPPKTVESDPAAEAAPESPSVNETGGSETPYDFESEGVVPAAEEDVQFEEDLLPPPESVESQALRDAPVEAEDLESLPTIDEAEPAPASVSTPVAPTVETPVPPSQELPIAKQPAVRGRRGFRVQLVALTELPEAERVAREARNRLGVETYVIAEPPYFKVRGGDFVDRASAALLRDRARANGYAQAWVTPTEIAPVEE